MPTHKIIVTNEGVLRAKYGAGYAQVQAAIGRLIAADAQRGLTTKVIGVDKAAAMAAAGGARVTNAGSARQNKAAIDALYTHYKPDYVMILGAVDVIPHQDLLNPVYEPDNPDGDMDQYAYSDLPYACPGGYSQTISRFRNPIRVVGRLPDVTRSANPAYLVKLLDTAANYSSRPADTYKRFLGVTAAAWTPSTRLSLQAAFGTDSGINEVPPKSYRWSTARLRRPSHFFNCHGALASPQYAGQPPGVRQYPTAHDAGYIAGKIQKGTVMAAECCYGAELYDAALAGGQQGIANQYLEDGGYGVFGSTTIAYGPAAGNDQADLICQYFFMELLAGASLGRAALQARQRYIAQAVTLSPTDLKTLAQFFLLGDPSVHPVTPPPPTPHLAKRAAGFVEARPQERAGLARAERRVSLAQNGIALAGSVGIAQKAARARTPEAIRKVAVAEAKRLGIQKPVTTTFSVAPPSAMVSAAGVRAAKVAPRKMPKAIHIAVGRVGSAIKKVAGKKRSVGGIVNLAGVEVVEFDDHVMVRRFVSR